MFRQVLLGMPEIHVRQTVNGTPRVLRYFGSKTECNGYAKALREREGRNARVVRYTHTTGNGTEMAIWGVAVYASKKKKY